jgi:hypothetical protein
MVDAELARAPEAAIEARWWRDGDKARFSVELTNQGGTTLSTAANDATVHAVVYEDTQVGTTDRYARAAVSTGVATPLAPGASATFSLETAGLTGVDWEQLHFLVLVDYRPGGASGAYDMLQAAVALPVRANYDLTVNAGTGCTITPPGPVETVPYKGSITFGIAPNTGYDLVDVKVDNISQGPVSSFAFSNVDADHTISATCARKQFTITPGWTSGGSIAPGVMQTVLYGDSIAFSITPDTGYVVDDVKVDGVSVGAVTSWTFENVTANHTIDAAFKVQTFVITAAAGANGSIAPSGAVTVNYGGSQTFTITPNAGYRVDDVKVDGVSAGAVTTYAFSNVTANHTIDAIFARQVYRLFLPLVMK